MKKFVVIMLSFLVAAGCNGQKKLNDNTQQIGLLDSLYNPNVDVRVNKQYDDKGNLIQFDSTYSYFYSSPGFNKLDSMIIDSLIGGFKFPLWNQYGNLMYNGSSSIFFSDSVFNDFPDSDYLSKRFHLNIPKFKELYSEKK